ncbi:MoaF C-terminal domain-containing protein [Saccharothrix variisporea]|uniref:Molybdenum cofactor biosynthesis protein F n=1 Tax=Saccharothrix variisporea TaxID=543527 RepID=A0A495X517_9PSEU|nr:MoaF C-terminal domain-containing protein [Saccharothrix variisporea]RKT69027.1 molybdenum cofactor biosynthesis protein F [Saccharothrix variisporea]
MTTLSDTTSWLPLDGLAPGFDQNKAPVVGDLDGRTFDLGGRRVRFAGGEVEWDGGTHPCETFLVDDGLYYSQFHTGAREAFSLFLDLRSDSSLLVTTTINGSGTPRVTQEFTASGGPAPSRSLIGRRAMWVYSADHAYEHIYLSPHWYTWQCLAGPEKGLADTDENTTYELRPGIYVFAWREKVIPCAAVTVADHRDVTRLRSHGALFGLDETGTTPTHFTFGAHGRLLSVQPALGGVVGKQESA